MTTNAVAVDLGAVPGDGGVVWSASPAGFHTNLVVLAAGQSIAVHRNDAVDVMLVVLAGAATVTVDDETLALAPANALLVPRGARRGITADAPGVRYLSIHGERAPMAIGSRRRRAGGAPDRVVDAGQAIDDEALHDE